MPRRPVFRIDPTAAASRTIAASAAGNVKQLETDFKTDKAIKDTKVAALEADKLVKDTKIATLESDKNDKDTRVAALESDKNAKDTKMSTMESDMTSLTSRVSTLESSGFDTSDLATKVSLGNLATRVTSLETLGISGISNAVSWTNLTEINLSGEKLTNGDFSSTSWAFDTSFAFPTTPTSGNYTFSETVYIQWLDDGTANFTENKVYEVLRYALHNGDLELQNDLGSVVWVGARKQRYNANDKIRGEEWEVVEKVPANWSVHSGTLDQTKLSSGIVDGTGGAVSIQQMFSSSINANTSLVCKVTRNDNGVGTVYINTLNSGGISSSPRIHIDPSVGYVEFTRTDTIYGLRLSTDHGLREVSDISLFQGEVSGGTVQAYAGGGLEKISGGGDWNAGASSVQKIDGNSDGYVQFQWNSKSVRIGLKYRDTNYNVASPRMHINYATNTVETKSVSPGDWFRIRHYASTNEIKYQLKETVYSQNTNFVFQTASGSNYQYISTERPTVISLDGTGNLTIGELYEVYTVRASDQALYLRDLDGNAHGYHGQGTRGIRFEVVEEAGQDYVSFYTEPTLTNGSDLYVDVSFYHVGARINDVTIVT